MGKDKTPKNPAPAETKAAEKKPIARGHRQRGAGTVITARPAVVTNDGITLKPHERLPTQLLNEYCQREKRPKPRFFPNPPGHRLTVLLEDGKNAKNDLRFTPVQAFESDTVARDYASLLALFHFQRALPLERKLPEPYATTWLEMTNAAKPAPPAGKVAAKSAAAPTLPAAAAAVPMQPTLPAVVPVVKPPAAPTAAEEKQSAGKSSSAKNNNSNNNNKAEASKTTAQEAPQWLCDNCGSANFAATLAGQVRTKCFKCQTAKPERANTVAAVSSDEKNNNNRKQKAAPKAVHDLRAKDAFVSRAAIEQIELAERAERNRRLTFFDALKRANRPKAIHLKPAIRDALEALFGLEHSPDAPCSIRGLAEYLEDVREEGIVPLDVCSVSYAEQAALLQRVCEDLSDAGRSDSVVVQAVKSAIFKRNDELVEDFAVRFDAHSHTDSGETESAFERARVVLEALLRETLHNSVYSRLSVVSSTSAKLSSSSAVSASLSGSERDSEHMDLCEDAVREIESLGWRQDATLLHMLQLLRSHSALSYITAQQREGEGENEEIARLYPLLLHTLLLTCNAEKKLSLVSFLQHITRPVYPDSVDVCGPVCEWPASLSEEKEVLESILGEKVYTREYVNANGLRVFSLCIADILVCDTLRFQHRVHAEFLFHAHSQYPEESPVVLLRNATSPCACVSSERDREGESEEEKRSDSRLLALNVLVQDAVCALRGSQVIFEIYSLLMNLSSGDELLEILQRMRFSRARYEALLSLCDTEEEDEEGEKKTLSEESIEETLSLAVSLTTKNEDDENDDSEENASLAATDAETVSSSASEKRKKKNTRAHPFWTRARATGSSNNSFAAKKNDKYLEMLSGREKLPSFAKKDEFLQLLPQNQVIVVTGETGCGKTTQMPQFIHESEPEAKILICQPRRLAAIGVASRVAEEQATAIGDRVGYMVKGDSKVCANTRIMFCTYGVLLRRLQDDPTIAGVDYVVFDEVHERGIDSDFCLALLMNALENRKKSLKLILMSATISTDHFRTYARRELSLSDLPPLLHIPGFTFPVTEFYKGDFEESVRAYPISSAQGSSVYIGGRPQPGRRKDVDYDLLLRLVFSLIRGNPHTSLASSVTGDGERDLAREKMFRPASGCVLVFLPGVPEINRFLDFFRQYWRPEGAAPHVHLIPLHGNVSPVEQRKVFQVAPRGTIKIVAATNVAEASVTIPDVTVVVDTCRVKEMGYDPETQAHALTLKFAAKDSLRQRKGRAGRVQEGRCFRLITGGTYEKLPAHSVPEMLRLPLESVVLQVWAMNSNAQSSRSLPEQCARLLSRCPDAPSAQALFVAQENLTSLQAIDRNAQRLTALGWHLSRLPCTPRVGRLLVYGCLLNCVFPVTCVAATMTLRSPFLMGNDPETQSKVKAAKEKFSTNGLPSDYNIIVRAMIAFQASGDQRKFCAQYGLAFERMLEIKQSMREFMDDLVDMGLLSSVKSGFDLDDPVSNANAHRLNLLAATYCAGLYPQVAKIIRPPKRFMEVMGSAFEREAEAKEVKLYVPRMGEVKDGEPVELNPFRAMKKNVNADFDINTEDLQRVFIHPSSVNFNNATFQASNYVLFGEKQVVQTQNNGQGKGDGTKIYLRDTSEVTAYALLFFGGDLEYNAESGVIVVDQWISFACSQRIADLVKRIRQEFDALLACKIEDPSRDVSKHSLLVTVCELLDSSEEENR